MLNLFVLLFFIESSFCVPYVNIPISDQHLSEHEKFEYEVSSSSYENEEFVNKSIVYMSLEPNEWIISSYGTEYEEIAKYEYLKMFDVFVVDNYIFAADAYFGLRILKIDNDDPTQDFEEVGSLLISGLGFKYVYVDGSNAYLGRVSGLIIIDVQDYSQPKIIAEIECTDTLKDFHIYLERDVAIIGGGSEISVYDISTKSDPRLLYTLEDLLDVRGLTVRGDYLFVCEFFGEFKIFNISKMEDPVEIGSVVTSFSKDVVLKDDEDFAYVLSKNQLKIIDISDLSNPFVAQTSSIFPWALDISVSGNHSFISTGNGFYIFDIKDKTISPPKVSEILDISSYTTFIDEENHLGYTCLWSYGGILLLNLTDPTKPKQIFVQSTNLGSLAQYLELVQERYIFVADTLDGISVFEIREKYKLPKLLALHDNYHHQLRAMRIATQTLYRDDEYTFLYVYVLLFFDDKVDPISWEMNIYNCSINSTVDSDPIVKLELVEVVSLSSQQRSIVIQGMKVYVGTKNELYVFDTVFDETYKSMNISYVTFPIPNSISKILVHGDYVYLGAFQNPRFMIFNISFPENYTVFSEVGSLNLDCGTADIVIDDLGNYIYLACWGQGVYIIDVTNKTNPVKVSDVNTESATVLAISNENTIIVGENVYGIKIIDVEDKLNPFISVTMTSQSISTYVVMDIVSKGNFIFIADHYRGIKVIQLDMILEGRTPEFSYFCGETEITVNYVDYSETEVSESFILTREDYCHHHGICIANSQCLCNVGFEGESCGSWRCDDIENQLLHTVCHGHGNCISPDRCKCKGGYVGKNCGTNILYATVMTPLLVLTSAFLGTLIISVVCVVCIVCCMIFLFLNLCLCGLASVVFREKYKNRTFSKLKNFDLYLKEQELEEDVSIAHLRINKNLFEINFEEIKLLKILGEGGSNSTVYKASWNNKIIAFKSFRTRTVCEHQDSFDEFEREVTILGSVSHPNILQFFGCCMDPPRVGIVMEFCEKGDLTFFLQTYENENDGRRLPFLEKLRLCFEIILPMAYLHSRNIIHRDLKNENVLIDRNNNCKLMDFGLSRMVENMSQQKTKSIGTSMYMAPELIMGGYDEKVDIFAFAICVFIVMTEVFQPYGNNVFNIEIRVATDPYLRPNISLLKKCVPKEHVKWLQNVIKKSWRHDPSERPTFSELSTLFSKGLNVLKGEIDETTAAADDNNNVHTSTVATEKNKNKDVKPKNEENITGDATEFLTIKNLSDDFLQFFNDDDDDEEEEDGEERVRKVKDVGFEERIRLLENTVNYLENKLERKEMDIQRLRIDNRRFRDEKRLDDF